MQPSSSGLRFLVAESEPPEAREKRRNSVGRSSGDTYLDILKRLAPGATCHRIQPADADCALPAGETLAGYDAVLLTGSPLALYEETPETRRAVAFMRATFASGTPPSDPAPACNSPPSPPVAACVRTGTAPRLASPVASFRPMPAEPTRS